MKVFLATVSLVALLSGAAMAHAGEHPREECKNDSIGFLGSCLSDSDWYNLQQIGVDGPEVSEPEPESVDDVPEVEDEPEVVDDEPDDNPDDKPGRPPQPPIDPPPYD